MSGDKSTHLPTPINRDEAQLESMAPHFVTERERREAVRKTTQLASQAIFVDAQVVSEHVKAMQRE